MKGKEGLKEPFYLSHLLLPLSLCLKDIPRLGYKDGDLVRVWFGVSLKC